MKHVRKSVLLWYSPREMFDLVVGVEAYPAFLPWCQSAEVLEQHADGVIARLGLSYMGVRQSFTTRNHNVEGESVQLHLVDGPFSLLDGLWRFKPLGAPGSAGEGPAACKIEFEMRYDFSSKALEAVVSPVFDKVANTFVDSFVKRAEVVYGAR
jgi:ribosome-associated toxin RatA of RatAB toxin-antitoxin module